MDLGLTGKVAMVTGASRGLGRAMAHALADEGMHVSVCARTKDTLNDAVAALTKTGSAIGFVGDMTKPEDAQRWVDETVKKFGGILNLFAPVRLARMCASHMEKRGGGSIINIGSIYGRESGGPLTYNASKAALHSFTKMLAREYAPKNIRVNTIAPGSILTAGGIWEQLFRENPAFEKDFISHEMPAGRLGRPDEIAYAVVMLASPRASWITGANIPVDGAQGRSIL